MNVRLTNFILDKSTKRIFAGDSQGVLYAFDENLSLLYQSSSTLHGLAIHGMTLDDLYIYTRDIAGNLVSWCKDTLVAKDFIVSEYYAGDEIEEGATPVPSPSNAIELIDNNIYVCNVYGTGSVFAQHTLNFVKSLSLGQGAFPECINAEHDKQILVTDISGRIWKAARNTDLFECVEQMPSAVIHSIKYDQKYNRYWCTSDITGGIFFLDEDGHFISELQITNDDVEEIALNSSFTLGYVGCFDHYIHVIENNEQPKEIKRFGRFKFQINHLKLIDDNRIATLLESGELYVVDANDGTILHKTGGTNAIWNLFLEGNVATCAMEDGNLDMFHIFASKRSISIEKLNSLPNAGYGRIRKALKDIDGDYVCISTAGVIFKYTSLGDVKWSIQTGGILRDLDLDTITSEGVACNEVGEIILFNSNTGNVIKQVTNTKPVWCISFDESRHIVFGERSISPATQPFNNSRLVFLDRSTFDEVHVFANVGNHKRIRRLDGNRILVNGNGNINIQIIDTQNFEILASFSDWIINTPENALVVDNYVYVITYGYQLLTYDLNSGELLDNQFVTEGYPKALEYLRTEDGFPFLVVGGRNFLSAFSISNGSPELVRNRYLAREVQPADIVKL